MQARKFAGLLAVTAGAAGLLVAAAPGVAHADSQGRIENGACASTILIRENDKQLRMTMSAPAAGCGARVYMTCYRLDETVEGRDSGTYENGFYPESTRATVAVPWPIDTCYVVFELKDLATGTVEYNSVQYSPIRND